MLVINSSVLVGEAHKPEYFNVVYLNGEFFGEWVSGDTKKPAVLRPVPSKISFRTSNRALYEIKFDEFETLDAFEKLGANGKKVYLEFEPLTKIKIKVRLYNDKESIELKKNTQ